MFYEYALEPSVLSSWDRARFFLDALGPWRGRFLAEYPRKWKKMVFEALACPDMEKKRIVERLAQLDRRVFSPRANAAYDVGRTWLANAEEEHARRPFHAIVAVSAPSGKAYVLDGAVVDDTDERWRVEAGCIVPRQAAAIVLALKLLVDASQELIVIDPYFRADQNDKLRPLLALCLAAGGRARVEVHFADEPRGYAPCMQDAARVLPRCLPDGVRVTLHCWRERAGGPRLHNRYLLTDVGGVMFGDGIETGSVGHEDHLSILDESSRLMLWSQYLGSPSAFDPGGVPQEFTGVK